MTREERFNMNMIDEFKQMCEIVEKDGRIIVNKQRMLKALEQEPFINKACVASQACHEDKIKVLDKIRSEIDKWHHLTDKAFNDGIDTALEIIDKYKAESEE